MLVVSKGQILGALPRFCTTGLALHLRGSNYACRTGEVGLNKAMLRTNPFNASSTTLASTAKMNSVLNDLLRSALALRLVAVVHAKDIGCLRMTFQTCERPCDRSNSCV